MQPGTNFSAIDDLAHHHGVDLHIAGHVHIYQRFFPLRTSPYGPDASRPNNRPADWDHACAKELPNEAGSIYTNPKYMASPSATDSTTSDMADHALDPPPPIELQGIVEHKTLHTLATYRRLCIYHTPPNNVGISLFSVIVIIQGEFSVSGRVKSIDWLHQWEQGSTERAIGMDSHVIMDSIQPSNNHNTAVQPYRYMFS